MTRTTIYISEEDHAYIMNFCKKHGVVFSTLTAKLWKSYIKKELKRIKKSA